MSIKVVTRGIALGLLVAIPITLWFGSCSIPAYAAEGEDIAKLKERFKVLSQQGNVECSVQFEKLIGSMGPNGRLQGSCCAPMDEARYRQQIEGLNKYTDIAEVPPDPYDIPATLAHKLMGHYDMALNKEEQAAYDYAMEHSDMEGPCCCKCWRWKVYGGLGKYLIHRRHYTGQQLTDLWNVGQGCGGPVDTKMH